MDVEEEKTERQGEQAHTRLVYFYDCVGRNTPLGLTGDPGIQNAVNGALTGCLLEGGIWECGWSSLVSIFFGVAQ